MSFSAREKVLYSFKSRLFPMKNLGKIPTCEQAAESKPEVATRLTPKVATEPTPTKHQESKIGKLQKVKIGKRIYAWNYSSWERYK